MLYTKQVMVCILKYHFFHNMVYFEDLIMQVMRMMNRNMLEFMKILKNDHRRILPYGNLIKILAMKVHLEKVSLVGILNVRV